MGHAELKTLHLAGLLDVISLFRHIHTCACIHLIMSASRSVHPFVSMGMDEGEQVTIAKKTNKKNKAGYTANPVAVGLAEAVMRKPLGL